MYGTENSMQPIPMIEHMKLRFEPYLIRLRYSVGSLLAMVAIGFVLLGAVGLFLPTAPGEIQTAVGGTAGQRLALMAEFWVVTIPVFAAVAWFSLKL